jgi:Arylsulfatase A and related enzymes
LVSPASISGLELLHGASVDSRFRGRYDYFATLSDREGVKYCHNPALNASQCTSAHLRGHVSMNDIFATAPLRDLARGYAAAISLVDEQFGKVTATLDELELAEKSVVIFVGDHGQNLGRRAQKICLFVSPRLLSP